MNQTKTEDRFHNLGQGSKNIELWKISIYSFLQMKATFLAGHGRVYYSPSI